MTTFVLRKHAVDLCFKCAQNMIVRGVYPQSLFKLEGWICNTKITYNSYLSLSHAHCQFHYFPWFNLFQVPSVLSNCFFGHIKYKL